MNKKYTEKILRRIREDYQRRLDATDEGRWVTTEKGKHIHFNEQGEIDKGNPHVIASMSGVSTTPEVSSAVKNAKNQKPSASSENSKLSKTPNTSSVGRNNPASISNIGSVIENVRNKANERQNGKKVPKSKEETPAKAVSKEKKLALPDGADLRQKILDDKDGKMDISEITGHPLIKQAQKKYERSMGEVDTDTGLGKNETIQINTPERDQLRQKIAHDMNERGSISGKDENKNPIYDGPVEKGFRAEIVIGPPAGGKSSVIVDKVSQKTKSRVLDSDEVKKELPEFDNGDGAGVVHKESADVILEKLMMKDYYKGGAKHGDNIVIPVVGKKPENVLKYAEKLKADGYDVHLSFNDVSALNSAKRATTRYVETGRFLSPEYIKSIGDKPSQTYEALKGNPLFASFSKYDNNVPFGKPADKIEHVNANGENIDWEDWR